MGYTGILADSKSQPRVWKTQQMNPRQHYQEKPGRLALGTFIPQGIFDFLNGPSQHYQEKPYNNKDFVDHNMEQRHFWYTHLLLCR